MPEPEDCKVGSGFMEFFTTLFGTQNHVSLTQEAARAVVIFLYALGMLRFSGRRTFAHWSAIDIVVSFIIGSALGRAMTGSAPFPGTLAAVAVIVLLHVLIGHLVARNSFLARWIEGKAVVIVDHGRIDDETRKHHMLAMSDLHQAMREEGLDWPKGLSNIKRMTLEPNGKISVVKHEPCRPDPA